MAEGISQQGNGRWQYHCACGEHGFNYATKRVAEISYRLHKLGHKSK